MTGPGRLGTAALLLFLLCVRHSVHSQHSEGYFSGTSHAVLNNTLSLKERITFAFRTCSSGVLLYQEGSSRDFVAFSVLPSGAFELKWHVGHQEEALHIGLIHNDNQWHNVDLKYSLGALRLSVGKTSLLVANATFRTYLFNISLHNDNPQLWIGKNFTGCLQEGANVILSSSYIQSFDVSWGQCPLPNIGHCEGYKTDPCFGNPCLHSGVCLADGKDYRCICTARYGGRNCENDLGPLCNLPTSVQCQHEGTCQEDITGNLTFCSCLPEYTGTFCETPFENHFCHYNPCQNGGTCTLNQTNSNYACNCPDGYVGTNCELNINECQSSQCLNNGSCIDEINGYSCDCTDTGYKGHNCEVNINECAENNPCRHGSKCFDRYGDYECICDPGFGGKNCDNEVDECSSHPCQNGATCTSGHGTYSCTCVPGYTGVNCETNIDNCENVHCPNNSYCIDGVDRYSCKCNLGFSGNPINCSPITNCAGNPCKNGALCENSTSSHTDYICYCLQGFTGSFCETNLDECISSPCFHGGRCIDGRDKYECACLPGYSGSMCEVDVNECLANPCKNGGTCTDLVNDFLCSCSPGWEGKQCEKSIDDCKSHPCYYGSCIDGINNFTCNCTPGYTGQFCEININDCEPNTCQNGGLCVDGERDFTCQCLDSFMGIYCNEEYNACHSSPCQNGGNCLTRKPSHNYTCSCPSGFTGQNCDINIDECEGITCPSNFQCVDLVNDFECRCPAGFTGSDCSVNIDECASNPCVNGTCHDLIGGFRCDCPPGITGSLCEEDIDECLNEICRHEGICKNAHGSYQCFCKPGFTGTNCEIQFNECLSQPCQNNGICQDAINNYHCRCVPGYSGRNCEIDIDECASNPCQNGASCLNQINKYQCICPAGYTGLNCETNIDECESTPCLHNGSCIDLVNGFVCNCNDTGFTGMYCENNINDCDPYPCQNEATCEDKVKDFVCYCHPGYEGKTCDSDIQECASSPCQNGALCLEKSNKTLYEVNYQNLFPHFTYQNAGGYICLCPSGFTGVDCEVNIDDCEQNECIHGDCIDGINEYHCACKAGYEGQHCNVEIDECDLYSPCQNGATCQDKVADYNCLCPENWGDKNCSTQLLGCQNNNCKNEAVCEPYLENGQHLFRCHCQRGFHGELCAILTTVSFMNESYWNLNHNRNYSLYDVYLSFRTTLPDGYLLSVRGSPFFRSSLKLRDGKLVFNIRANSGKEESAVLGIRLNDSNWKDVHLKITTGEVFLNVSGQHHTMYFDATNLSTVSTIIGKSPLESQYEEGFVGCVQEVRVNEELMLPASHQGQLFDASVGCHREDQCLPDPCNNGGVCVDLWHNFRCDCFRPFFGESCNNSFPSATFGYLRNISWTKLDILSHDAKAIRMSVDISFFMRTRKAAGLLFYLGTGPILSSSSQFYSLRDSQTDDYSFLAALLEGSQLKVILKIANSSNPVTLGADTHLDDGELHFIQIRRNYTKFEITLDSETKGVEVPSDALLANALYLGWIQTHSPTKRKKRQASSRLSGLVADSFGNVANFKGILQDFRINNKQVKLANSSALNPFVEPQGFGHLVESQAVLNGIHSDEKCTSNPCQNGGTCEEVWNSYKCHCTNKYRGNNCTDVKPCFLSHCPSLAVCQDLEIGYECVVPVSFNSDSPPLMYHSAFTTIKRVSSIYLRFRSRQPGTLFYMEGPQGTHYFISVQLNNESSITMLWNLGESEVIRTIVFGENSTDGDIHAIEIIFSNTSVQAKQKDVQNEYRISEDNITMSLKDLLNNGSTVYLGGGPKDNLPFKGCLEDVRMGGVLLPFLSPTDLENSTAPDKFDLLNSDKPHLGCVLCWDSDCQNEGRCENVTASYDCSCTEGFEGQFCEKDIDECIKPPCENGGLCHNHPGSFECACHVGYEGQRCETEIQYCSSSPCQYGGTCTQNEPGFYNCSCSEEYIGKHCERKKITDCSTDPCYNGGTCTNTTAVGNIAFHCSCRAGYTGQACEVPRDFCESHPCLEGSTCSSDPENARFICTCSLGYTGLQCETEINYCTSDPCQNGAYCHNYPGGYQCHCSEGYAGSNCEADIDECTKNLDLCSNGGTCKNQPGNFICECPSRYFGKYCEFENLCDFGEFECLNGGTCEPIGNRSAQCLCHSTFRGSKCQEKVSAPSLSSTDLSLVIGITVACLFLLCFIVVITVFLRMAKKKRATRGTYSPSRQEMFGSRVEMNHVMKPPPEERLI